MLAVVVTVLAASLLGSLHCAGMCGGLLAVAVSDGGRRAGWATHAAYHLGRLWSYATLGILAGVGGWGLDKHGQSMGLPRPAAIVAASVTAVFGLLMLGKALGWKKPTGATAKGPAGWMSRAAVAAHRKAFGLPVTARAGVVGLLTPLIPCGWLYAFVATAGGTGNGLLGGLVMAVFWAGTLPAMVSVGAGLSYALGSLSKVFPALTASLVVLSSVLTASGRVTAWCHASMPAAARTVPWCNQQPPLEPPVDASAPTTTNHRGGQP